MALEWGLVGSRIVCRPPQIWNEVIPKLLAERGLPEEDIENYERWLLIAKKPERQDDSQNKNNLCNSTEVRKLYHREIIRKRVRGYWVQCR
jgi:hypothetical protein